MIFDHARANPNCTLEVDLPLRLGPRRHRRFTWRMFMNLALVKTAGAGAAMHRPFCWRPLMNRPFWLALGHPGGYRWLILGLLAAIAAPGCGHEAKVEFNTVSKPPTVQVINPPIRNIVRVVGQPSFIEAYRAHLDLSQAHRLYQGMESRHRRQGQEGSAAGLPLCSRARRRPQDEAGDRRARQRAGPAREEDRRRRRRRRQGGRARLEEAKAILDKYQADVERWDSEVKRSKHEVDRGIVDPQILLESTNQLKASTAARDAARATIDKADGATAFQPGDVRQGPGRRQGRRRRPGSWLKARKRG